ncbi:hypothetical protein CCP4SC76_4450004 [Gammaproteobacteria bacterium]
MIAGALRLSKLTGQNGSNIPEFLDSPLNGFGASSTVMAAIACGGIEISM